MASQTSQDDSSCILVARMDNVRNLSSILKTVTLKEVQKDVFYSTCKSLITMQMATCFVSANGLKVTVEQAKCVQANAFIQSSLFQQFTFNSSSPAAFRINLNALIVSM